MTFWQFLNDHKTKITGTLITAFGALQAMSETLRGLMEPQAFGWFTVIAGVTVAALGFINGHQAKKGDEK